MNPELSFREKYIESYPPTVFIEKKYDTSEDNYDLGNYFPRNTSKREILTNIFLSQHKRSLYEQLGVQKEKYSLNELYLEITKQEDFETNVQTTFKNLQMLSELNEEKIHDKERLILGIRKSSTIRSMINCFDWNDNLPKEILRIFYEPLQITNSYEENDATNLDRAMVHYSINALNDEKPTFKETINFCVNPIALFFQGINISRALMFEKMTKKGYNFDHPVSKMIAIRKTLPLAILGGIGYLPLGVMINPFIAAYKLLKEDFEKTEQGKKCFQNIKDVTQQITEREIKGIYDQRLETILTNEKLFEEYFKRKKNKIENPRNIRFETYLG